MSKVISVRLDDSVRDDAKKLAADLGLSLSSIINSYLKQVSATRQITLFAPEVLDSRTNRMLVEIDREKTSKSFSDVDDLMTDLEN
ncbi:MAG TPA: type II toxin-antitoxin system RelB/DinJ family antitoxin [Candidatus Saccharibacteria bacterium]|jgi:addiction module RelB/DinJ family antitoxin|nr:type II toxin-antitoxin system RelB/DinJ family antitoxin [Candidatus Saccharibacteria bacterium]